MEISILPGVHMFERSEFGPKNGNRQILCHEFIKQLTTWQRFIFRLPWRDFHGHGTGQVGSLSNSNCLHASAKFQFINSNSLVDASDCCLFVFVTSLICLGGILCLSLSSKSLPLSRSSFAKSRTTIPTPRDLSAN